MWAMVFEPPLESARPTARPLTHRASRRSSEGCGGPAGGARGSTPGTAHPGQRIDEIDTVPRPGPPRRAPPSVGSSGSATATTATSPAGAAAKAAKASGSARLAGRTETPAGRSAAVWLPPSRDSTPTGSTPFGGDGVGQPGGTGRRHHDDPGGRARSRSSAVRRCRLTSRPRARPMAGNACTTRRGPPSRGATAPRRRRPGPSPCAASPGATRSPPPHHPGPPRPATAPSRGRAPQPAGLDEEHGVGRIASRGRAPRPPPARCVRAVRRPLHRARREIA